MGSGRARKAGRKVRYAVVGLGHIAQVAVLPAFAHARRNSELALLVSGDAEKRRQLARRYQVEAVSYAEYATRLERREFEAVYVALPNNLHCEFTVDAARAGVHVLCEKPMAVTEADCHEMIGAARDGGVKLMVAYRLHFERTNLEAVRILQSGKIGEPRLFDSVFSMQVRPGNVRLEAELGGGTLYDIGVYCINAARSLFRDEPEEVYAQSVRTADPRFREIDEMTSAVLRFPGERLATFTSSFGAADVSTYRVVGTAGQVQLSPAYEYAVPLALEVTVEGRTRKRTTPKRDQFCPELLYFSDCVLENREPEPNGEEGLADVRVIQALYESAAIGQPTKLPVLPRKERPTVDQQIECPPVRKPEPVRARSASG